MKNLTKQTKLLVLAFCMMGVSSLSFSGTLCQLTTNPDNNGSCSPEYQLDQEGVVWVLTGTSCTLYKRNTYGAFDCKYTDEEIPDLDA